MKLILRSDLSLAAKVNVSPAYNLIRVEITTTSIIMIGYGKNIVGLAEHTRNFTSQSIAPNSSLAFYSGPNSDIMSACPSVDPSLQLCCLAAAYLRIFHLEHTATNLINVKMVQQTKRSSSFQHQQQQLPNQHKCRQHAKLHKDKPRSMIWQLLFLLLTTCKAAVARM